MPTPPDSFFYDQERQLSLLVEAWLLEYDDLLESARKDLFELLASPSSFNQSQALELIPQVDQLQARLRAEILAKKSAVDVITPLSTEHATQTVLAITGRTLPISFNAINDKVLERFARNELEKVTSIVGQELQTTKSILFTKVGVQGVNPGQLAKQIAGKNGTFKAKFGHVQTVLRTETSTIYNAQAVDGIQQANTYIPDDNQLKKRIVETLDKNRNHAISRVLNGQIRAIDKPFEAKQVDIIAAARAMKKPPTLGGIFWPLVNGVYRGDKLPAHYNERGIVVAAE